MNVGLRGEHLEGGLQRARGVEALEDDVTNGHVRSRAERASRRDCVEGALGALDVGLRELRIAHLAHYARAQGHQVGNKVPRDSGGRSHRVHFHGG